jgi:hypothetical protein
MRPAYIGPGIFLLVVGAILNWAVADQLPGVNLHMVGIILMAGGALAIILSFAAGRGGYRATRTAGVDASGNRVEQVDVDKERLV